MPFLFSLFFLLTTSTKVDAAACCGGGFAAPSIITGDDKAQVTISAAQENISTDVYTNGLWKKRDEAESVQTLRIEAAHLLSDRWQAGLAAPIVQRSRAGESSSGLGDVAATLGYEYLPDWDYNPIRPKGIGFLQVTLPTGKSIYESENIYGLDSHGRGFWALGAGTLLTKTWTRFDAFASFEVHRSFDKSIDHKGISGTLKPGWGSNVGIGAGYNTSDFRFGGSLHWSEEDAVDLAGSQNSKGAAQKFARLNLLSSYMASEELAWTLSYSDQTILGNPSNTSLGRSVSVFLQKRWPR